MKEPVHPSEVNRPSLYHRFLHLLCCLKVIPVSGVQNKFCLVSLPTLLSTFWCWASSAYYIFVTKWNENSNSEESYSKNITESNNLSFHETLDKMIFIAFLLTLFLLMLLLPGVLGYFFATNYSAMLRRKFTWPLRGWILVLSTAIFVLCETATLCITTEIASAVMPTERLVHFFMACQLFNLTAASLQFIAIMLVSTRQTSFIEKAFARSKDITYETMVSLVKEYENISNGVGPFYMLEFFVHVLNILCFTYFGLVNVLIGPGMPGPMAIIIWSCGSVTWSSLMLTHICLMSDDCFEALQCLVSSVR
jgi:hypothetical protein